MQNQARLLWPRSKSVYFYPSCPKWHGLIIQTKVFYNTEINFLVSSIKKSTLYSLFSNITYIKLLFSFKVKYSYSFNVTYSNLLCITFSNNYLSSLQYVLRELLLSDTSTHSTIFSGTFSLFSIAGFSFNFNRKSFLEISKFINS